MLLSDAGRQLSASITQFYAVPSV